MQFLRVVYAVGNSLAVSRYQVALEDRKYLHLQYSCFLVFTDVCYKLVRSSDFFCLKSRAVRVFAVPFIALESTEIRHSHGCMCSVALDHPCAPQLSLRPPLYPDHWEPHYQDSA